MDDTLPNMMVLMGGIRRTDGAAIAVAAALLVVVVVMLVSHIGSASIIGCWRWYGHRIMGVMSADVRGMGGGGRRIVGCRAAAVGCAGVGIGVVSSVGFTTGERIARLFWGQQTAATACRDLSVTSGIYGARTAIGSSNCGPLPPAGQSIASACRAPWGRQACVARRSVKCRLCHWKAHTTAPPVTGPCSGAARRHCVSVATEAIGATGDGGAVGAAATICVARGATRGGSAQLRRPGGTAALVTAAADCSNAAATAASRGAGLGAATRVGIAPGGPARVGKDSEAAVSAAAHSATT